MAEPTPPTLSVAEREVSASVTEFLRCLAVAHGGPLEALAREGDGTRVQLRAGEVVLDIHLTPLPPRRIALITLPTLRARYRFLAGAPAACADFLRRLDRGMQRGGG